MVVLLPVGGSCVMGEGCLLPAPLCCGVVPSELEWGFLYVHLISISINVVASVVVGILPRLHHCCCWTIRRNLEKKWRSWVCFHRH